MTWLIALAAKWGIPEPLCKAAVWASIVAALSIILFTARTIYDSKIVSDYELSKTIKSIDARDEAADQRAKDELANSLAEKESSDAIKNANPGDAQLRLDCLRLERIGRIPEPCRRFGGD